MNSKVITCPVVESEIMNAREAAEYLKISYWLIMRMARNAEIPTFRCGNRVMFRKSTIDSFIRAQEVENYNGSIEME